MTLPNFLLIGAPKSGTTSLYEYLRQHPQVFMSEMKEPNFFAFEGESLSFRGSGAEINKASITQLEKYKTLFYRANHKVVGEASTLYLYIPKASERIKYYIPEVKLIAVLRNPVDRAYSSFLHLIRQGREPIKDFEKALLVEEERIKNNWIFLSRYKDVGLYYSQLKRYYDKFDSAQIKVFLYDDLKNDCVGLMKEVYDFLEVDNTFLIDSTVKFNISGLPKSLLLQKIISTRYPGKKFIKSMFSDNIKNHVIKKVQEINLETPPKMSPTTRTMLTKYFEEDIVKCQELIQRDLSMWINSRR